VCGKLFQPVEGMALMEAARRRATVGARIPAGPSLANGPGKLCQALEIDLTLDGADLLTRGRDSALYLLEGDDVAGITVSQRIGISKASDALLRFTDSRSPWLSRRRGNGLRSSV